MHRMLTVAEIEDSLSMLPPFPRIVLDLLATVDDEAAGQRALATFFKRDPISASLLQASTPDASEPDAEQRWRRQREMVLINSLVDFAGQLDSETVFLEHNLTVALLAQELGRHCGLHPEFALVAGLLHDIGRSWMACYHPRTHLRANQLFMQSGRAACEVEHELFGMDHSEVGYCAARTWGVPAALLNAIARHHRPHGHTADCLVATIHLADLYSHVRNEPRGTRRCADALFAAARTLGIDLEMDVAALLNRVDERVHQTRAHLHGLMPGIGHDVRFG